MKILVACEESQAVTKELRRLGHEAYSCDIIDCSGGHPEWHIQQDVLKILNPSYQTGFVATNNGAKYSSWYGIKFTTCDGNIHDFRGRWDMIIAFPPCTYLTVTGNRWFNVEKYGKKAIARQAQRACAIQFFMDIARAKCDRIAIENPIGIMSTQFRKPDQIIQPWQFALTDEEETEKSTCLWLKGLAPLVPLTTEKPDFAYHEWTTPNGKIKRQTLWYYNTRCLPHKDCATAASKTFPGIAKAMAEQWAGVCETDADTVRERKELG